MKESNLKNIVVLKDLPSNIVEEAFVILKSNKNAKKLEKIENSKKTQATEMPKKNKDYILKEAEMILTNYLSKIDTNEKKENKALVNRKYKRLKKYAYISSCIIFLQSIMLIIK